MSYFPQWSAKEEFNPLRRKEVGSSLAADILRGHNSGQTHYTIGCLTGPACAESRKHLHLINLTSIHSKGVGIEDSIESRTALESLIPKNDSPIRSRLPPPPLPPSQTGCVPLPIVNEDIFPSHSYQRRPSNMGWNGTRGSDSWQFEGSMLYENPINCLPTTNTSTTNGMKIGEEMKNRNVSMNNVADSSFKDVSP